MDGFIETMSGISMTCIKAYFLNCGYANYEENSINPFDFNTAKSA